jgi:hypothetical protein
VTEGMGSPSTPSRSPRFQSRSRSPHVRSPRVRAYNRLWANFPSKSGFRRLIEKRTRGIQPGFRYHHPYALVAAIIGRGNRSSPSLKSLEYGVALGHPSRDASATRSAATTTPNINDRRPTSLVIISTLSDASSHALHLPLDEDVAAAQGQGYSERPKQEAVSRVAKLKKELLTLNSLY